MWTVYDHPADYPQGWIARRFEVAPSGARATSDVRFGPSLEAVRALLPEGLIRLDRMPDDDPKIAEVWL